MTTGKPVEVWIVCDYYLRCLPESQFAQADSGGYVCKECAQEQYQRQCETVSKADTD